MAKPCRPFCPDHAYRITGHVFESPDLMEMSKDAWRATLIVGHSPDGALFFAGSYKRMTSGYDLRPESDGAESLIIQEGGEPTAKDEKPTGRGDRVVS